MEKGLIKKCFRRSIPTYDDHALVQKIICEKLIGFLNIRGNYFQKVLEIGAGTGLLTKIMLEHIKVREYIVNDLVEETEPVIKKVMKNGDCPDWTFLPGDAEIINVPGNLDLVVSGSTIQWFTKCDLFFNKLAGNMNKGGLFAFNLFGKRNYIESRSLTGLGLHYPEREEIENMLKNHFEILISQEEIIKMKFPDPAAVLNHFRKTGVNGLNESGWTKTKWIEFIKNYKYQFLYEDGVALTYHPLYFVAQKK
jgi:malonyl-ACP O-methyltransferase BioC